MAPDWLTAAAWLYPSVCFSGPQREWSDKSRRLFATGDVRAGLDQARRGGIRVGPLRPRVPGLRSLSSDRRLWGLRGHQDRERGRGEALVGDLRDQAVPEQRRDLLGRDRSTDQVTLEDVTVVLGQVLRCTAVSTPSATTVRPRSWPMTIVAATMGAPTEALVIRFTKDMSIFKVSIGKPWRRLSIE